MLSRNGELAHYGAFHDKRLFIERDDLAGNPVTTYQGNEGGVLFHDDAGASLEDDLANSRNRKLDGAGDIFSFPEEATINSAKNSMHEVSVCKKDNIIASGVGLGNLGFAGGRFVLGQAVVQKNSAATDNNL